MFFDIYLSLPFLSDVSNIVTVKFRLHNSLLTYPT